MGFLTPKYPNGAEPPKKGELTTHNRSKTEKFTPYQNYLLELHENYEDGPAHKCSKKNCKAETEAGDEFCSKHMRGGRF
jgi:hypothetical protein